MEFHSQACSRRKSEVTWDEEVIAEHDKLRGTRMKIDEPDTPFEHGDGIEAADSDDELPVQEDLNLKQAKEKEKEMLRLYGGRGTEKTTTAPASLADQWNSLAGKLEVAASEADAGTLKVGAIKVEEQEVDQRKKSAFKDKRAAHYNEFERVKEMRAKAAMRGDEDEEDDD
mmetsp:Transcript_33270/g.68051  ORF Transcript_33270/g.68051 Transcript_33270/m.68051 type:complete len:171 (-) Transcript_33270:181-693(-)